MSWTLIEHQSLSNSAASVTLGSGGTIPQTYKSLKLLISSRNSSSSALTATVEFNGSTSNRSSRLLYGEGSNATSATGTTMYASTMPSSTYTANTFGNTELTIPNYTSTTVNKASSLDDVSENNATTAFQVLGANLWSNTAAITSITLQSGANFVSGSTFTLYGLK